MILAAIVFSQMISVCAQVSLKLGIGRAAKWISSPLDSWRIIQSPLLWLGGSLYLASTVIWLRILSIADLSFAYPFAALAYAGGVLVSQRMLKERVTFLRWLGVAIILSGLILIAMGAHSSSAGASLDG